jgi:hypothetical protein
MDEMLLNHILMALLSLIGVALLSELFHIPFWLAAAVFTVAMAGLTYLDSKQDDNRK